MAKKDKSGRRTKNVKYILIAELVLLLIAAAAFFACDYSNGLELKGSKNVSTELGREYKDPGVRSPFAHTVDHVDVDTPGYYSVEYTLWGQHAVRRVHVVDPEKLVLGLKGSETQIVRQGDPYVESGAFATDRRRGALSSSMISISGGVDTGTPGEYTVKYSVSSGDITKEKERKVKVVPRDQFVSCKEIPVMMYHWIYSQDDLPDRINGNWIEDRALEEHLRYLDQNGYYYPSWRELDAWIDGRIALPEKSIILTFDDGKKAFFEHGRPLFEKYKIPVTSFMICWEANDAESKIKKYASEYIDIESHSYAMHQAGGVRGHKGRIAAMTKEEIRADLRAASAMTGSNDAFAYPYGDYTPEGQEALIEQGVLCSFTIEYGRVVPGMDKTRLPRVRVMSTYSFDSWKESIGETPDH